MTVKESILYGSNKTDISEVYILLCNAIKRDKLFIISHSDYELTENEEAEFLSYISKRCNGIPVSYITNAREFYGRDFFVNDNVLIPRPETELIIDVVKSLGLKNGTLLDICTGSGIIGITLALETDLKVTCSDISKEALKVAKKNSEFLKAKVDFIQSDMFENIKEKFDLIVSNPPYIPTEEIKALDRDVRQEPIIALDGGLDGLDFYRLLISKGKDFLNKDGKMIFEIGYNQSEDIKILAEKENYKVEFFKDLQNYNRVALLYNDKVY